MKSMRATGFPCSMSTMRMFLWMLLVLCVAPIKVEGKIFCYVCSWDGPDDKNTSFNAVDTCSPTNFQAERARTVECNEGCEATSYKDYKNDKLIHFYRNCVGSSSGDQLEDRCFNVPDKANRYYSTCECTSDYCNSSVKSQPWTPLVLNLVFISLFLAATKRIFFR